MYSNYILKAQQMAVSNANSNEVMRSFAESSFEELRIESIRYFRVNVGNKIELVSSFGDLPAPLESDNSISRTRKIPICDAINSGKEMFFSTAAELIEMYEEVKLWSEVPNRLVLIPVHKLGITLGCLSVTLDKSIEKSDFLEAMKTFRFFAYLIELISGYEKSRVASVLDSCESVQWVKSLMVQGGSDAENSLAYQHDKDEFHLTERQYKIAALIANGATNTAIARELCFSNSTIRYETVKLYERLRVKNRSEAAARIRQLKIA